MSQRTPYKPGSNKGSAGEKQKFLWLKTSTPLLLTIIAMAVVYFAVLLPKSPDQKLNSAIANSFGAQAPDSYRYDSSFTDENRDIYADISGQKSSNGDTETRIQLKNEDDTASIRFISVGSKSYVRIEGVENLKTIVTKMSGIRLPTDEQLALLASMQNTWVSFSPTIANTLAGSSSCFDSLTTTDSDAKQTSPNENFPLEVTMGPLSDTQIPTKQRYEAVLAPNTKLTDMDILRVPSTGGCVDDIFGVEEPGLRNRTPSDDKALKFSILVDTLSNTVDQLVIKEVGRSYALQMRDYGKDVSVNAPDDAVSITSLYQNLSSELQSQLLALLGIQDLSVLQ